VHFVVTPLDQPFFFFLRKIAKRQHKQLGSNNPLLKKRVVNKKSLPKAIAAEWQHRHNNDMGKP